MLVTDRLGRAVEVEIKDGGAVVSRRHLTEAQEDRMHAARFWVVGCAKCAAWVCKLFLNPGGPPRRISNGDCCGVRGPVDGLTYWRETKGGK